MPLTCFRNPNYSGSTLLGGRIVRQVVFCLFNVRVQACLLPRGLGLDMVDAFAEQDVGNFCGDAFDVATHGFVFCVSENRPLGVLPCPGGSNSAWLRAWGMLGFPLRRFGKTGRDHGKCEAIMHAGHTTYSGRFFITVHAANALLSLILDACNFPIAATAASIDVRTSCRVNLTKGS